MMGVPPLVCVPLRADVDFLYPVNGVDSYQSLQPN